MGKSILQEIEDERSRVKKVLQEAVVNSQAMLWEQDADNLHGQERINKERAIAIVQTIKCAAKVLDA